MKIECPPTCPRPLWDSFTDQQKQAVIFHEEMHKYVGFLNDFIAACEKYRECNEIPGWLQELYRRSHDIWVYPRR